MNSKLAKELRKLCTRAGIPYAAAKRHMNSLPANKRRAELDRTYRLVEREEQESEQDEREDS